MFIPRIWKRHCDGKRACAIAWWWESSATEMRKRAQCCCLRIRTRIRRWMVWEEPDFPRTPTQKPLLPRIREAIARQLRTAAATAGDERASGVADLIARVMRRGNARVSEDADLERDLQMSSLDRVELMSALEEKYQVDLGETRFAEAKTVGEL